MKKTLVTIGVFATIASIYPPLESNANANINTEKKEYAAIDSICILKLQLESRINETKCLILTNRLEQCQ